MGTVSKKFFQDKNIPRVARSLLGNVLMRRYRGETRAYIITDVEAYDGPRDKASHAYRGKTARNALMFGEAGRWYVYFVYGMYWMLNMVTGPKEYPAAILIRGAMAVRSPKFLGLGNPIAKWQSDCLSGPGRLTRALHIDKSFNGQCAGHENGLWIEDWGIKIPPRAIRKVPRIGVSYAHEWAQKPYRFVVDPVVRERRG